MLFRSTMTKCHRNDKEDDDEDARINEDDGNRKNVRYYSPKKIAKRPIKEAIDEAAEIAALYAAMEIDIHVVNKLKWGGRIAAGMILFGGGLTGLLMGLSSRE